MAGSPRPPASECTIVPELYGPTIAHKTFPPRVLLAPRRRGWGKWIIMFRVKTFCTTNSHSSGQMRRNRMVRTVMLVYRPCRSASRANLLKSARRSEWNVYGTGTSHMIRSNHPYGRESRSALIGSTWGCTYPQTFLSYFKLSLSRHNSTRGNRK